MHYFPVQNLPQLSRGGDSSRKHKGEPILRCRRCAKEEEERQKREKGIGCGYEALPDEEEILDETSEATLDLGCDKCQDRRRKKKRAMNTSIMPSGMLRLQGQEVLGQVQLVQRPATAWAPPRPAMAGSCPGHARMGQTCPTGTVPLDPTLNCQHDARGNTVCSNGLYFPPGCPKTPPDEYFSPGIAPDEVQGTIIQAKIPPARGTAGAPPLVGSDSGSSGAASSSSAGSGILPYAAGGIATIGLLYALLR